MPLFSCRAQNEFTVLVQKLCLAVDVLSSVVHVPQVCCLLQRSLRQPSLCQVRFALVDSVKFFVGHVTSLRKPACFKASCLKAVFLFSAALPKKKAAVHAQKFGCTRTLHNAVLLVPHCESWSSQKETGVSYHEIASDQELCEKWLKVISRDNWTPHSTSCYSTVCSRHFVPSAYKEGCTTQTERRRCAQSLRRGSIIFTVF